MPSTTDWSRCLVMFARMLTSGKPDSTNTRKSTYVNIPFLLTSEAATCNFCLSAVSRFIIFAVSSISISTISITVYFKDSFFCNRFIPFCLLSRSKTSNAALQGKFNKFLAEPNPLPHRNMTLLTPSLGVLLPICLYRLYTSL